LDRKKAKKSQKSDSYIVFTILMYVINLFFILFKELIYIPIKSNPIQSYNRLNFGTTSVRFTFYNIPSNNLTFALSFD